MTLRTARKVETYSTDDRRSLTICVVDDEDLYREYLVGVLSEQKHRVVQARSSGELLQVLNTEHVDCILLDYMLVTENGIEVFQATQRNFQAMPPVVMLTMTENDRTAIKAFRVGMDDFFFKRGMRGPELISAIGRAVAKRAKDDDRKLELDRLRRQSAFDSVTGLYTRQEVDRRLVRMAESADRRGSGFAVVTCVVNELQTTTDRFGMVVGDRALRAAGIRMQASVRASDFCGRYEDSVFIYVMEAEPTPQILHGLCSRLDDALRFEFRSANVRVSLSAMLGTATYPQDGDVPWQLIEAAARNITLTGSEDASPPASVGEADAALPASSQLDEPTTFVDARAGGGMSGQQVETHTDRRKHRRHRVLKGAQILLNDTYSTIDCTVWDLSEGGARLRFFDEFSVPETFFLLFPDPSTKRRVARRWQQGTQVGVEFVA